METLSLTDRKIIQVDLPEAQKRSGIEVYGVLITPLEFDLFKKEDLRVTTRPLDGLNYLLFTIPSGYDGVHPGEGHAIDAWVDVEIALQPWVWQEMSGVKSYLKQLTIK